MLADFLQALRSMGREADSVQVLPIAALQKVGVRKGDTLELHDLPPRPRSSEPEDFASFVGAVVDPGICPDPEVWVGQESVDALVNRQDRSQAIRMRLATSSRWRLLKDLVGKSFTNKEAVKMLRLEFGDICPEQVIQALSRIDFQRRGDGSMHVDHGRESLGRSVEASVQQADAIPKSFQVNVCPWTNMGVEAHAGVTITLGIYLDVEAERVQIQPLGDQMALGMSRACVLLRRAIDEALGESDIPVFAGTATRLVPAVPEGSMLEQDPYVGVIRDVQSLRDVQSVTFRHPS